jgi:hypothetical protein
MQVPDWRLGQLIVNATSPTELIDVHKLFNIEDNKMEKRLAALSQGLKNRTVDQIRLADLKPIVPPEAVD